MIASDMVTLIFAYAYFIANITHKAEASSRIIYKKSMELDSYAWTCWAETDA